MLKLKDCELLNFDTGLYYCDSNSSTHGYSPRFVNKITVETTNYVISIEINSRYDYALSQSDCIKRLTHNLEEIQNMTEKKFIAFLKNFFEEERKKRIMETNLIVYLRLKKTGEK